VYLFTNVCTFGSSLNKTAISSSEIVQIDSDYSAGFAVGRQKIFVTDISKIYAPDKSGAYRKMRTILLGLLIFLTNFSAFECSAQKSSKLPVQLPEKVEIHFTKNAGMIFAFTKIAITNQAITVEEKDGSEKQARKWSAKIELDELENLYRVFVENRFDTLKNEERKGIVYDAGSEGVSITIGTGASYSISYGPNSPLSADHRKRYQAVADAINALRAKYESKAQKTGEINFAVLNLSEEIFNIRFQDSYPAKLSEKEIASVKNFLREAVNAYNTEQRKDFAIGNLAEYKFQFIAFFNEKGGKEVWVNGLCSDFERDWRSEIIQVKDGGSCYFNLYVNLTKQSFNRFRVNGSA